MSRDRSGSDGLTDWALVSQEGSIEGDDTSNGSSSDDFVNVTQDGVAFARHRSRSVETSPQPEVSGASVEASNLLQRSMDELEEDGAPEDARFPAVPGVSSMPSSMTSTGDESLDVISEDDDPTVVLPSSIGPPPPLSPLSPGPPGAGATTDGAEAYDGVVASVSTHSLGSTNEDELVSGPGLLTGCLKVPDEDDANDVGSGIGFEEEEKEEEGTPEGDGGACGGAGEEESVSSGEAEWLKLPSESLAGKMNAIRLGDGRVIVAPPGADLETLMASLHTSIKSETSSDTDSDFVRLDCISTCSSSNDNSDTDVEDASHRDLASEVQEDVDSEDVMTASVSSVSSRFRFIPHRNRQAGRDDPSDVDGSPPMPDAPLGVPLPLPDAQDNAGAALQPAPGAPHLLAAPGAPHLLAAPGLAPLILMPPIPAVPPVLPPPVLLPVLPPGPPARDVNNEDVEDGDTESVSGHSEDDRSEDDRIENNDQEDEDMAFNDIADIPLVAGHPQYRHSPNRSLNWTLDVVVVTVILVAVGVGIGHSIGSMREHYLQYEMHRAQQNRMSLLQDDLLECHQKTDELLQRNEVMIQTESARRREVVADLIHTNSELRGQMDALEDEMTTQLSALSQCRELGKELRQVSTGLRNKLQHLRDNNIDPSTLYSASTQDHTNTPRLEESAADWKKQIEGLRSENEELRGENKQLRSQNEELRSEYKQMKYILEQINAKEDAAVEEELEASRSTDPPACPKMNDGQGAWTDLKSRINLLEQENADLRTEIGRLRYKSHPGNLPGSLSDIEHTELPRRTDSWMEEDVVVEAERPLGTVEEAKSANETSSTEDQLSAEVERLKVELNSTHRQISNWKHLYLNLKDRESQGVKCNKSTNLLTCMRVLAHRLNTSINMTSIKEFVNITKFLTPLEEVGETFLSEFHAIWKQFSGFKDRKEENDTEEEEARPRNAQKMWSDNLKDILNKTQSSMSTMSQQIKATWTQVKNLSEELWNKHEPALSKVATKISEKVKKFSSRMSEKFQQKTSKWFQKVWKHKKHRKHGCKKWETADKDSEMHKKHERKGRSCKEWQKSKKARPKEYKDNRGKDKKSDKKKQNKRKKYSTFDVHKDFRYIKKRMDKMTEEKHLRMTETEVKVVCRLFIGFQTNWDIYKWLYATDVKWTICQSAWWHDRLRDRVPSLLSECKRNIYGWQYEWAPSVDGQGNFFKPTPAKQRKQNKKLKNILERNRAKGKPYSYEEEKAEFNQTRQGWFHDDSDDDDHKEHQRGTDWYEAMMEDRLNQRNKEHKSDWIFDRAANRGKERTEDGYMSLSTFAELARSDSNGVVDPRAEWMFARAEDRDYHHGQPDSWYYKRSEMRRKGHDDHDEYVHRHYDSQDDEYNNNKDDDDDYHHKYIEL